MKVTVKQLAELNGSDPEAAYALVRYLREVGLLVPAGPVPKAVKAVGRPESYFEGEEVVIRKHLDDLKFT